MQFYRKCWFDLFKEQFIFLLNFGQNYFVQLRWNWFSVRLPVTNCHSMYTASQAMLERGVCELAHFFFHMELWSKGLAQISINSFFSWLKLFEQVKFLIPPPLHMYGCWSCGYTADITVSIESMSGAEPEQ